MKLYQLLQQNLGVVSMHMQTQHDYIGCKVGVQSNETFLFNHCLTDCSGSDCVRFASSIQSECMSVHVAHLLQIHYSMANDACAYCWDIALVAVFSWAK